MTTLAKSFSHLIGKKSMAVHNAWGIVGQICTKSEMSAIKNQRLFKWNIFEQMLLILDMGLF